MIRCVLFDLDGTLLDTAPALGHALNLLLTEHSQPPVAASQYRQVASAGARGLLRLGFGLEPTDDRFEPLRQRYLHLYHQHLTRETYLFEGIETVIQELGRRDISWGVVTNKPGWLTQPLMDGMTFPSPPCCVISGDSTPHPKPHPAPLLLACEHSGRAPGDCVYVGDASRDIEAGRGAGMRTIAAGYGYIETGDDPGQWGADGLIQHPLALIQWLNAQAA